jgi:hypothetical protein
MDFCNRLSFQYVLRFGEQEKPLLTLSFQYFLRFGQFSDSQTFCHHVFCGTSGSANLSMEPFWLLPYRAEARAGMTLG